MTDLERTLLDAIDPESIKALTLDLAAIPSPTGDSQAAAEEYGRRLHDIGLDVDVTYEIAGSPNVAARLRGLGGGPTLQLAGHLDTIPTPHDPPHFADGLLYGRGTADMKGGLAAMAETARVLKQHGVRLKGDLLLTAFGLHEAPGGHGEGLRALVQRGVKGDAAIVCEVGGRGLPIAGKGMGIFEITVRRSGDAVHELQRAPGTPNPILAANRVLARLEALADQLAAVPVADVGPESIFIGMVQSGDFYNRVPVTARIVGTRRHSPDKTFDDVQRELRALIAQVQAEDPSGQISIDLAFQPVRESFRLDPSEPLVGIVRGAYQDLMGASLPLIGISVVADAPILMREGNVPTVYHGPLSDRAHSDLEYIALDELVRVTRMYILCALRYCRLGA